MMKALFLVYYYLLANGLVLFCISIFRLKKNPATKYYFLQYLILLLLVAEFVFTEYIFRHFTFYCYADFPVRFLLTPFIYLYVCTYTNPHYRPSKKTLAILFVPALLELICFAGFCFYYAQHPQSFEERMKIANSSVYYIVRTFLALFFNIACVFFAYKKVSAFRWNIFKVLSDLRRLNVNWLKVILGISVFLWVYWLFAFVCEITKVTSLQQQITMYYALYLLIALVVLVFGYFAILKPYVPEAYIKAAEEIEAAVPENPVTPFATGTTEDASREKTDDSFRPYFNALKAYFENTQKFREPDITLVEIAKALNTNSFNISKAIKLYSREGSFYEFINRYRIIYFLELLGRPENDTYTITALALQSGFTSTTTLNKYCKKITGTTPARAKQLLFEGKKAADLLLS